MASAAACLVPAAAEMPGVIAKHDFFSLCGDRTFTYIVFTFLVLILVAAVSFIWNDIMHGLRYTIHFADTGMIKILRNCKHAAALLGTCSRVSRPATARRGHNACSSHDAYECEQQCRLAGCEAETCVNLWGKRCPPQARGRPNSQSRTGDGRKTMKNVLGD